MIGIERGPERHVPRDLESRRDQEEKVMIDLPFSLVIEATEDPEFFAFYSEELQGFSGVGNSVEDCLYKAKWGMRDHVRTMREQSLPVPPTNPSPSVVIQNERKLQRA
jgi:predicted RNase H-like HicB family nuclease